LPKYDLVVLGGGFGGYPAAVVASQHGLRVALVEARELGGECTNYACIPLKAMLHRAYEILIARSYGAKVDSPFGRCLSYALEVVKRIRDGISLILENWDVKVYRGTGRVKDVGRLEVGGEELEFDKLMIATGTDPSYPPGLEADGKLIHDNRTIMNLDREPEKVVIVGGGPAGVEYADLFARLGAEVYVVEMLDRILPFMDRDLSMVVARYLREHGVKIRAKTVVNRVERKGGQRADVLLSNGEKIEDVDLILVATGRRPATHGLGLELLGVRLDAKGYVKVDSHMRSVEKVYAAGDVTGPPLLAHKAYMQSIVAGLNAAGVTATYHAHTVPMVVYTGVEALQVGFTLEEARSKGFEAEEVKIRLGSVSMAVIKGAEYGVAKIVYEKPTGKVLGVHVAAPGAGELAGEAMLAVEKGVTVSELAETMHPHPSISEAILTAAELAAGRPVNYVVRRRTPRSA
jgi:dihydrolipoamide dehydrogenase